jgi:glycosyltransferase involved in cell wall biosynthesis
LPAPRVSFVIPTYNYGRYIAGAIDSLLSQTYGPIELIVIDDASTDDTGRVLDSYLQDPRVRIVRHTTNHGHIRTYNEGLRMARGEFVGLLSADDVCLSPTAVERQVAVFDSDPQVGFVYSALTVVDDTVSVLFTAPQWPADGIRPGIEEFRRLLFENLVPASGTLVRKALHERLGYYDEGLAHAGDWDLWLRLAAHAPVGFVADSLYGYRVHGDNMHRQAISPVHAYHDNMLVLDRAFGSLEGATADVWKLRRPALRAWAVRAVEHERQRDDLHAAVSRAREAARTHPELIIAPRFIALVLKIAIHRIIGNDVSHRFGAWRRGLETR